jgi:hypothetical protein
MNDTSEWMLRLSNGSEFGPASIEMMCEWAGQRRVPADAQLVDAATGERRSVLSEPRLRAILQAPPTTPTGPVQPGIGAPPVDTGFSRLIPARNPCALAGYYIAVASLIPCLALLTGPIALVLGIIGLRARLKNPAVHGLAHAWVAIIGGAGLLLLNVAVIVLSFSARW